MRHHALARVQQQQRQIAMGEVRGGSGIGHGLTS
jgi:hypothetical protein